MWEGGKKRMRGQCILKRILQERDSTFFSLAVSKCKFSGLSQQTLKVRVEKVGSVISRTRLFAD